MSKLLNLVKENSGVVKIGALILVSAAVATVVAFAGKKGIDDEIAEFAETDNDDIVSDDTEE